LAECDDNHSLAISFHSGVHHQPRFVANYRLLFHKGEDISTRHPSRDEGIKDFGGSCEAGRLAIRLMDRMSGIRHLRLRQDISPAIAMFRSPGPVLIAWRDWLAGFPKFRDGRAYGQARHLRERDGFRGELRAKPPVLRDQFSFPVRAGFDAFEVVKMALPQRSEVTGSPNFDNDQSRISFGRRIQRDEAGQSERRSRPAGRIPFVGPPSGSLLF
jgi:Bacterial protein of unknown function (DUF934)